MMINSILFFDKVAETISRKMSAHLPTKHSRDNNLIDLCLSIHYCLI